MPASLESKPALPNLNHAETFAPLETLNTLLGVRAATLPVPKVDLLTAAQRNTAL